MPDDDRFEDTVKSLLKMPPNPHKPWKDEGEKGNPEAKKRRSPDPVEDKDQ